MRELTQVATIVNLRPLLRIPLDDETNGEIALLAHSNGMRLLGEINCDGILL